QPVSSTMAEAPVRMRLPPGEAERWLARRRWSRAGLVYLLMLVFSLLFLGPLLFATISSLKPDPLAYPPTLTPPQLSPANWAAGPSLGRQGAGEIGRASCRERVTEPSVAG